MIALSQVTGALRYGTQRAREGYEKYQSKRVDDKPVSTKQAVQELRTGYFQYIHNPIMGSFTGRTVRTKKSTTQQQKMDLAILKQTEKNIKLRQKAAKKPISVSYEDHAFGNYELNFTGQKPGALRSSGFDINEMFK